jgi:hypothetical protein
MTTALDRTALTRHVHVHGPDTPVATVVVRAVEGDPHGDAHETSEAAWVAVADLSGLPVEPPVRIWITEALSSDFSPHLG